ncbi:toxin-antitoxin system YwqK family antitoxin [Lewinella sp. JB7]|uniref:toxin-antitoxin system YwqK family antitoxin n=1 Tax=Lewinella sp. JB7 TaxID=2962887 RepID=UPI0020C9A94C|nr:hypothetical protein [Lewinella sp. JB7]MCP9236284.1 hypothetical protein [Lewinella sp. JB7]
MKRLFHYISSLSPILLAVLWSNCTPTVDSAVTDQSVPAITVPADRLTTDLNTPITRFAGVPFTGTAVENYPDGTIAVRTDYLNGRRHGLHRKYFPDGRLSFASHYVSGRQDGETRSWWSNGNLRSVSRFVDGVASGVQEQWYDSGAPFKTLRLVDGREEGLQQAWRENGQLYNNYEARDGRTFGLRRANLCYTLEDEEVRYAK